jgi:GT2 family glycosyltransferase/tetratricopeptide (TPR) repeat protein
MITALLTFHRRPHAVAPQAAAVRAQSVKPAKIWAFANDPHPELASELAKAGLGRVVTSTENTYFHARFALAMTAATEYVAIFDDDAIPGPEWFANCLETMAQTPGILGAAGIVLHGPGYARRTMHGWQRPSDRTVEVDLVGQAWFLRTEWVRHLFAAAPVTGTNGEDIELAARAFRLAGVRSYCPPHPVADRARWGSTRGLELGVDAVAASLTRANHEAERDAIVRAELAAGWLPLYGREQGAVVRTDDAIANCQLPTANSKLMEAPVGWDKRSAGPPADTAGRFCGTDAVQASNVETSFVPASKELVVADAEDIDDQLASGPYDRIDFGESLALQRDPLAVLRRARTALTSAGQVTATFANARHHTVVAGLLKGDWLPGSAERGTPSAEQVSPTPYRKRPNRVLTVREVEKLFFRAGFTINELSPVPSAELAAWREAGSPGEVNLGAMRVSGLSHADAEQFHAAHYRAVAAADKKAPGIKRQKRQDGGRETANDKPLVSIVVATHNALPFTQQLLPNLRHYTDEPYELIFVDNASNDGTQAYLRSCGDVTLIENAENRGFPAAANQGARGARGEFILFLNNDVLVTTGWLTRMLRAFGSGGRVGLVGPSSNCVSGAQEVVPGYDDLTNLDGWAWEFGKQFDGRLEPIDRLVGFCLLVRREVLDQIGSNGPFDERFGLGNFEDDDLCRRAIAAGWQCVIARDGYIHHFGHASFAAAGVDLNALLEHNAQLYAEKWAVQNSQHSGGASGSTGHPRSGSAPIGLSNAVEQHALAHHEKRTDDELIANCKLQNANCKLTEVEANPQSADPLRGCPGIPPSDWHPHSVSACLIVRDSQRTIRACITSLLPWVDEIVVLDTGSTDDTAAICLELGCRVYHMTWPDSFAAARNESLKYARGWWIFWMDADDIIDEANGPLIRELVKAAPPEVMAYIGRVLCPGSGSEGHLDVTAVHHAKLFRNLPGIGFEFRIHEQVLPSIRRLGGRILFSELYVVHAGADRTPEGYRRKLRRDLRLLKMELAERPECPFTLFNLGMTYADAKKYRRAVHWLRRSIAASERGDSQLRKAYALLASSLFQLRRYDETAEAIRQGRELFPEDVELLFREGLLFQEQGRFRQAARAYKAALASNEAPHFASLDVGLRGFKTRHNLARLYGQMGNLEAEEAEWRKVVAEAPTYREGWRALMDCLMERHQAGERHQAARAQRQEAQATIDDSPLTTRQPPRDFAAELKQMATSLLADRHLCGQGYLTLARLARRRGDTAADGKLVALAIERCPDDVMPLRELAGWLWEHAGPAEAATALEELIRRDPDDAPARFNLGLAYCHLDQYEDAVALLKHALRIDPHYESARTLLTTIESKFVHNKRAA